jgi:hypothetical protein
MADATKFDPFKPAQPSIPGVPAATPAESQSPSDSPAPEHVQAARPRKPIPSAVWAAVGLIIVLGLGGGWMLLSSSSQPASQQVAADASASTASPYPDNGTRAQELPVAPGIVATTREIEKPWASKRFVFRSDLSAQPIPALVVHLPNGQYWGLSMVEPFGTCKLEYITDLSVLRTEYNFRANHPMVGDPCTHTVYDLLQYDGGTPDGGLVRGAIVHGAGVRPPIAIEIEVAGKNLRAVRIE